MRVTRKSLETLCANVNEARVKGCTLGGVMNTWCADRSLDGLWYVYERGIAKQPRTLAAGMTASECERFLQGALEVARS